MAELLLAGERVDRPGVKRQLAGLAVLAMNRRHAEPHLGRHVLRLSPSCTDERRSTWSRRGGGHTWRSSLRVARSRRHHICERLTPRKWLRPTWPPRRRAAS
jgi:hypothetical protein